jgi:hypothetical protein
MSADISEQIICKHYAALRTRSQPQRSLKRLIKAGQRPAAGMGAGRQSIWIAIRSILMYDMYPWDKTAAARRSERSVKGRRPRRPRGARTAEPARSATRAVQIALDRRDNGGDAVGASGRQ